MSFRFRLQRILELREKHEQACARELGLAESAAEAARAFRDQVEALEASSRSEVALASARGARVGHLQQLGTTITALEERLEDAEMRVAAADAGVAAARLVLESAARDRRVLDRLKEHQQEQFHADSRAADRVQMDEVALSRFSRMVNHP